MANPRVTAADLQRVLSPVEIKAPRRTKASKHNVRFDAAGRDARMYHGVLYHSRTEAEYASHLDILMLAGEVRSWSRQRPFPLLVGGRLVANYIADFVVEERGGREVIQEVKGWQTPDSKLKMSLLKACYPATLVKIVRKSGKNWKVAEA